MNKLKTIIIRLLIFLRCYPNIFLTFMPFKILEFQELTRGVPFLKDDLILDIGCGKGIQTTLIAEKCRKVIGIDTSVSEVNIAKQILHYLPKRTNVEILCTRLEHAGFPEASFDKIFGFCVMEHIHNYEEVLRESWRVLKKNGQMFISLDSLETIEDETLIEKHRENHSVVKYFRVDEFKELLLKTGFRSVEAYPIFKSPYAKRLFIKGIRRRFKYGFLYSLIAYFILQFSEQHHAQRNAGIFIIAKCYK